MIKAILVSLALLLAGCATTTPYARVVVISESYTTHPRGLTPLDTAASDATHVHDALADLGSRISAHTPIPTLNEATLEEAKAFLFAEPRPTIALIYIAAHGFQENGHTFFRAANGDKLSAEEFMSSVMEHYPDEKKQGSIFLLDICREEQNSPELRPDNATLVRKSAVILFASSANDVSNGGGSPFARAIAHELPRQQELRESLRNIIEAVAKDTRAARKNMGRPPQNPWPYGLILFNVYLGERRTSGEAG
jgi:hypothetical protein